MERKDYVVVAEVTMVIPTSSPEMAKGLAHAWLAGCPNNAVAATKVLSVVEAVDNEEEG